MRRRTITTFEDGEPLVVEEGGDLSVTVFVNPAVWFVDAGGTAIDLREFDFDTTGEVFELLRAHLLEAGDRSGQRFPTETLGVGSAMPSRNPLAEVLGRTSGTVTVVL